MRQQGRTVYRADFAFFFWTFFPRRLADGNG